LHKYIDLIDVNDSNLIHELKTKTLIYTVELINFTQMYDITGKHTMMKYIISPGKGVDKPIEGNTIYANVSLYLDYDLCIRKENIITTLSQENFNQAEIEMVKTMKKSEKSKVEIKHSYLKSLLCEISVILDESVKEKISAQQGRIIYEIELIKFKQKYIEYTIDGTTYTKSRVMKGIGNQCPWKRASVMIAIDVKQNGNIVHSDFESLNLMPKLKDIKLKLKQILHYEMTLQFLLEKEINNLNYQFPIFDLYTYLLPDFITECLVSMRLMETQTIKFKGKVDYFNLISINTVISDTEINDYEITITLLNYQENFNLFNKSMQSIEDTKTKVIQYRSFANNFFQLGLFIKSRNINKYLVDEYIKYINLNDKKMLSFNQKEIKQSVNINVSDMEADLKGELKKAHSNLITILFKLSEFVLCNEYIELFMVTQNNMDEKVLYIKYKILYQQKKFEESREVLRLLYQINSLTYRDELTMLENKIDENLKQNNTFVKKMFRT
jgi:hypothetical protein